jgi:hypothetical protein
MADENDNMDEDKRRRDWDAARAKEKADLERRAQEDTARRAEAAKFQHGMADKAEAERQRTMATKNVAPDTAHLAKPAVKAPVYLVDIKEDPHVRGSLLVEATAPDGTVESATFSGPRASHRAMKYVEAIEGFERRPPREYPKYVRRGGVEHILLDAEHEKQIGPPTDADKAADESQKKAAAEVGERHVAFDEAQARTAANPTLLSLGPRPERLAEGESDEDYAARLDKWQADRRGVVGAAPNA